MKFNNISITDEAGAGLFGGNSAHISASFTIPENYNSLLFGPITIVSDITVTISSESTLKIVDLDDI
jgi:hypothetical protein